MKTVAVVPVIKHKGRVNDDDDTNECKQEIEEFQKKCYETLATCHSEISLFYTQTLIMTFSSNLTSVVCSYFCTFLVKQKTVDDEGLE